MTARLKVDLRVETKALQRVLLKVESKGLIWARLILCQDWLKTTSSVLRMLQQDLDQKEIDLLLLQNGVISPIEIKKSASPGKTAIKNFSVLEPVTREAAFDGIESLKVEIGTGNVICMANDLLPLDEKNWYVPVWLI